MTLRLTYNIHSFDKNYGYLHVQICGILNILQQTGSLIHFLSNLQTESDENWMAFYLRSYKFENNLQAAIFQNLQYTTQIMNVFDIIAFTLK
jgi:hypothetical protein